MLLLLFSQSAAGTTITPAAGAITLASAAPTSGQSFTITPAGAIVRASTGSNAIRNPDMTGAAAGAPGTLPANWAGNLSGVTREVSAVGTSNGVPYIDVRLVGTPTGSSISLTFENGTAINAVQGDTFQQYAQVALVSGSLTNVSQVRLSIDERTATTYVATQSGSDFKASLTASLQQFSRSVTMAQATTARVQPYLSLAVTSGLAIDVTLRIAAPWLFPVLASAPTVTQQLVRTPAAGALTITGSAPVDTEQWNDIPAAATLTLAGAIPRVGQSYTIAPPTGVITLSGAAPTFAVSNGNAVQTAFAEVASAGSVAATFPLNVTAGNTVIVAVAVVNGSGFPTISVADSRSTSYTLDAEVPNGAWARSMLYSGRVGTSGACTVTVSSSRSDTAMVIAVLEYAGVWSSGAFDASGTATATSTTPSATTSGSTSLAQELVVAVLGVDAFNTNLGITPPSGWTNFGLQQNAASTVGFSADYKEVSATGSQSASWGTLSGSSLWFGAVGSYRLSQVVRAANGAITVTGAQPRVGQSVTIRPANGALTITGVAPVDTEQWFDIPAAGALTLTGAAPAVGQSVTIRPNAGTLTLAGAVPAGGQSYVDMPAAGALTVTGAVPVVGQSVTITAGGAVLHLSADANTTRSIDLLGSSAGSPGTLPTYTSGSSPTAGLTRTIIGSGVDATTGLNYIDARWAGTASGSSEVLVAFDSAQTVTTGETWKQALYLAIVGGSTTGFSNIRPDIRYNTAGGAIVQNVVVEAIPTLSSTLKEYVSAGKATDPTIGQAIQRLTAYQTVGNAVDITFRIAYPRMWRLRDTAPSLGLGIAPAAAAVTVSGAAPVVGQSVTITPAAATLTLSGRVPLAGQSFTISPAAATLTLTAAVPLAGQSFTIRPSAGAITLAAATPLAGQSFTIRPANGALTVSGRVPLAGQSVTIRPAAAAITLAAAAPGVANRLGNAIQSVFGEAANASSLQLVVPIGATAGNTAILAIAVTSGTGYPTITVSDTLGTTYAVDAVSPVGSWARVLLVSGRFGSSGACTVTIASDRSDTYFAASLLEYAGVWSSGAFDASGTSSTTSTTPSVTTSGSTSLPQELAVAVLGVDAYNFALGISTPSGWTTFGREQDAATYIGFSAEYKEVSSAGSQSASWGTLSASELWFAAVGSYRLSQVITPAAGPISLSGVQPTVGQSVTIRPAAGTLTLAGYAPVDTEQWFRTPAAAALTIAGQAAGAGQSVTIRPAAGVLTLAGAAPLAGQSVTITPSAGTLALTGRVPLAGQSVTITPAAGALVVAGAAPSADLRVTPAAGALTVTGRTPSTDLRVAPSAGALTVTGRAPSLELRVTPAAGALTVTGRTPSLELRVTPPAGALALTGRVPLAGQSVTIRPGAGALTASGAAPGVAITNGNAIQSVFGEVALASSLQLAFPLAVVANDTGIIAVTVIAEGGYPTISVSDSLGTTYTQDAEAGVGSWARTLLFSGRFGSSGANTVTISSSRSDTYIVASALEYAGVWSSGAFDASGVSTGSSDTPTAATSGSTALAQELVVAVLGVEAFNGALGITTPAGYTSFGLEQDAITTAGFSASYRETTGAGTQSVSWGTLTGTVNWTALVGSYRLSQVIAPAAGALSFSGAAPRAGQSVTIRPSAAALTVTGYTPTDTEQWFDIPAAATLTLVGSVPTVGQTYVTAPAAAALTLTGRVPTVGQSVTIRPAAGTLSASGAVPTVGQSVTIAPAAAGALTVTGRTPSLELRVTPAAGALTVTGRQPTVGQSVTITPAAASLGITGVSAQFAITIGRGIQSVAGKAVGTTLSVTYPLAVTAGNTGILAVALINGAAYPSITVTDSLGTTYSADVVEPVGAWARVAIFSGRFATGGACTVTVASDQPDTYMEAAGLEYAGLWTSGALDASGASSATSSTPSATTSGSTSLATELVFGALLVEAFNGALGIDPPAGYNNIALDQDGITVLGFSVDWREVGTTGSQSISWGTLTGSENWSAAVATYRVQQTITPAAGTLPLVGAQPRVGQSVTIRPAAASITLTGRVPLAGQSFVVRPAAAAITLAGAVPLAGQSFVARPFPNAITLAATTPVVGRSMVPIIGAGATTITGRTPTVGQSVTITPSAGSLTLVGRAPSFLVSVSAKPAAGALTLTGAQPRVGQSVTIRPDAAALAFAVTAPEVGAYLTPSSGALTLTGAAPLAGQSVTIRPAAGALALSGAAPLAGQSVTIRPAAATITFAGAVPLAGQSVTITPSAGALALTGAAPPAGQSGALTPSAGALTLTGAQPLAGQSVTIRPAAGALALTGAAPLAGQSVTITPSAGALVLAAATPLAGQSVTITPAAAALVLSGAVPLAGQSVTVRPAQGVLTLAAAAPTSGQSVTVRPAQGVLTLAAVAPSAGQSVTIRPAAGAITLAAAVPTVGQSVTITPSAGSLALSGAVPLAGQSVIVRPDAAALLLAAAAPTAGQSITIRPAAGALSVSGAAPTAGQSFLARPAAGAITVAGAVPRVGQSFVTAPTAAEVTVDAAAPRVGQSVTIRPDPADIRLESWLPLIAPFLRPDATVLRFVGNAPIVVRRDGSLLSPIAGQDGPPRPEQDSEGRAPDADAPREPQTGPGRPPQASDGRSAVQGTREPQNAPSRPAQTASTRSAAGSGGRARQLSGSRT